MVFGAKLRTVMSSIIRWRKGETLRAVRMGNPAYIGGWAR
jgi:hypothetical protein